MRQKGIIYVRLFYSDKLNIVVDFKISLLTWLVLKLKVHFANFKVLLKLEKKYFRKNIKHVKVKFLT